MQIAVFRSFLCIVLWLCLSGWLTSSAKILSSLPVRQSTLSKHIVKQITAISAKTLDAKELEQLLQVSNVQEIIWRLREAGDDRAADTLYQLITKQLQHNEITAINDIDRGASKPQLLELEGGLRAVFKSDEINVDAEREVLLHKIDYEIGTNVVPITVLRTIDGRLGSLQLFIENSLAADEVATHKLMHLGFNSKQAKLGSHNLHTALTPERSPAAQTLQLLTIEGDSYNAGNYLLPKVGRQIAIDGSYAFDNAEYAAENLITKLQQNMNSFLLDERIAAKLESILNADDHPTLRAIRELDMREGELLDYDDLIDYLPLESNMRLVHAAYSDALTRRPITRIENGTRERLLNFLSKRRWQEAESILAEANNDLKNEVYFFASSLQELAVRNRDHNLLRWLHANIPDTYLNFSKHQIANYATHTRDVDFTAKLKTAGFEIDAPDTIKSWQESIYQALTVDELKVASRLMDKLVTNKDDTSHVEFLLDILHMENIDIDARLLNWLGKYEGFFKKELAANDRLVDLLAIKIKRYTIELSEEAIPSAHSLVNMIAFLGRVCACQQLGNRIVKSFKQFNGLMLVGKDRVDKRLNKVINTLQANGMSSSDADLLMTKLPSVLNNYGNIDDMKTILNSLFDKK